MFEHVTRRPAQLQRRLGGYRFDVRRASDTIGAENSFGLRHGVSFNSIRGGSSSLSSLRSKTRTVAGLTVISTALHRRFTSTRRCTSVAVNTSLKST
jgi:hypothetical protein